jgi:hypothetical protein
MRDASKQRRADRAAAAGAEDEHGCVFLLGSLEDRRRDAAHEQLYLCLGVS